MASTTVNMGLIKWTEGSDPYDHTQLATNFQKIDEHDHTSGKGARLKGSSLEAEAIGTAQLANASVTNAKLAGGITADKLTPEIVNNLGDLKWWWRPNESTPLPSDGWQIAGGQSLTASEHDFPGGGTIILPNLIGKFPYGVVAASIGNTGGVATINLNHDHNVNSHQHTINPHNHPLNLESGFNANTNLKVSQDLSGNAWVHSDESNNQPHRHSIAGSSDAVGLTTNGAGATTDSSLSSSQNILPPYVGLLPLIKVEN
jgi:hypothetical protein